MNLNFLFSTLFSTSLLIIICINSQAASWGCKAAKLKSGKTTEGCIEVNNLKRGYKLHVPSNIVRMDKGVPLIIGLHGGGGKPKQFEKYSRLSLLSDHSKNFIAVYPKGIKKYWNDGRPNVNSHIDDIEFLKQLVRHLKRNLSLHLDMNKIFIIGMSNGGLMAMRAACELNNLIAGIGVVAASMTTETALICKNKTDLKPLATVFIFGNKETSFLANGKQVNPVKPSQLRGTHIGINATVKWWADINNCMMKSLTRSINTHVKDNTSITKTIHTGCSKPTVLYSVNNGGHRWPNADASNGSFLVKRLNLGLSSHDIDSAEEILKIFISSN